MVNAEEPSYEDRIRTANTALEAIQVHLQHLRQERPPAMAMRAAIVRELDTYRVQRYEDRVKLFGDIYQTRPEDEDDISMAELKMMLSAFDLSQIILHPYPAPKPTDESDA